MVTIPPEVVRIRASSTVFVKASSLVNLDFGAMSAREAVQSSYSQAGSRRGQSLAVFPVSAQICSRVQS